METVSETRAFDGVQGVYRHPSTACNCPMTFGLFQPREARDGPVPVLWYLSGLTCTHENAMVKAGAQRWAAEHGIALVFPDTSPRGEGVPDDPAWDMGQGAGFYVNATEDPWSASFRMWDYVAEELPALVFDTFPLDPERQAITGHSMGGHGALTLAMRLKGRFRSVSAFAPISNPTQSEWGRKQLACYLGPDPARWRPHDSALLMAESGFDGPLLCDWGTDDEFFELLRPGSLFEAAATRRQEATLRLQKGYDHSYFFVASFMEEHVAFHAEALWA